MQSSMQASDFGVDQAAPHSKRSDCLSLPSQHVCACRSYISSKLMRHGRRAIHNSGQACLVLPRLVIACSCHV